MLEDLKGEIVERLREELVLQKLANRADNDKAWREKFPELVVRVYGNTGREEKRGGNVRKVVVEAANHALMKGPSEMTVAPLRAVMEDIGEFAADLVEEQVKAVRMERSSGFFEGSEEGEKA